MGMACSRFDDSVLLELSKSVKVGCIRSRPCFAFKFQGNCDGAVMSRALDQSMILCIACLYCLRLPFASTCGWYSSDRIIP
ncbi:hypothetical protein M404DRAFT_843607 [Pisolithus tinctorius Marx 270]|uniref:Uncharacterized protein n=1 Tax=Pisolithus tinctorius Marx 270 TaxID=870435 RepID=A0A0C3JQH9_PISTI|nr:hypothetical protein M404DRAFT_843607 [Pisolithus tinctorius Marx 270]